MTQAARASRNPDRSWQGRSLVMRSLADALGEFLRSPAVCPQIEGYQSERGAWTNEDIVVAVCGARGTLACDPALYDMVQLKYGQPGKERIATFERAFAACARPYDKRGHRDWRDFDLGVLQECHTAFRALCRPTWLDEMDCTRAEEDFYAAVDQAAEDFRDFDQPDAYNDGDEEPPSMPETPDPPPATTPDLHIVCSAPTGPTPPVAAPPPLALAAHVEDGSGGGGGGGKAPPPQCARCGDRKFVPRRFINGGPVGRIPCPECQVIEATAVEVPELGDEEAEEVNESADHIRNAGQVPAVQVARSSEEVLGDVLRLLHALDANGNPYAGPQIRIMQRAAKKAALWLCSDCGVASTSKQSAPCPTCGAGIVEVLAGSAGFVRALAFLGKVAIAAAMNGAAADAEIRAEKAADVPKSTARDLSSRERARRLGMGLVPTK